MKMYKELIPTRFGPRQISQKMADDYLKQNTSGCKCMLYLNPVNLETLETVKLRVLESLDVFRFFKKTEPFRFVVVVPSKDYYFENKKQEIKYFQFENEVRILDMVETILNDSNTLLKEPHASRNPPVHL